jgi:hypothetical protein
MYALEREMLPQSAHHDDWRHSVVGADSRCEVQDHPFEGSMMFFSIK